MYMYVCMRSLCVSENASKSYSIAQYPVSAAKDVRWIDFSEMLTSRLGDMEAER